MKKGIYFAGLIAALCVGCCHYMNLLAGQDFCSTTNYSNIRSVVRAFVLSAVFGRQTFECSILVHELVDFSYFRMI